MVARLVVIGGSAAGAKAAARARRLDEGAEITIIERGEELSVSSCGLAQYVGGAFDNRNLLMTTPVGVVRDVPFFQNVKRITALVRTEAIGIDRERRIVECKDLAKGGEVSVPYDKLVIATGSRPRAPSMAGADLQGVMTLHSLKDADRLREVRDRNLAAKAVVIGGSAQAVEVLEALHLSGIETTMVVGPEGALPFMDRCMSMIAEGHMRDYGATVIRGREVVEFIGSDGALSGARLDDMSVIPCDLAVIAAGQVPDSDLAVKAGLAVGGCGGIVVDEHMTTSDPDIYAAGACVGAANRITGHRAAPLWGDLSNVQGRVAGENAIGAKRSLYPGSLGTGICKVFDMVAGATGLSEEAAKGNGMDVETVTISGFDRPVFSGGKMIVSKMVAQRNTGKVVGFQCVGSGDVSKQIAQAAIAITGGMTIHDIANADLPNAPSFAWSIDNLMSCAHAMQNKMDGAFAGIAGEDLRSALGSGERFTILDLRTPDEFKGVRLGIGETHIPLGALRKRKGELPQDPAAPIVCYCKTSLRGYEGARALMQMGYRNVKVLEGGISAWPYDTVS